MTVALAFMIVGVVLLLIAAHRDGEKAGQIDGKLVGFRDGWRARSDYECERRKDGER